MPSAQVIFWKFFSNFCFAYFNFVWIEGICSLKALDGDGQKACEALFYKYFYNSETGKCEQFIYGGCGGNENRFATQQGCEEYCIRKTADIITHWVQLILKFMLWKKKRKQNWIVDLCNKIFNKILLWKCHKMCTKSK